MQILMQPFEGDRAIEAPLHMYGRLDHFVPDPFQFIVHGLS